MTVFVFITNRISSCIVSYENDELNVENMLDYTIESSIFTFALWSIGNELMASYTPNTSTSIRSS